MKCHTLIYKVLNAIVMISIVLSSVVQSVLAAPIGPSQAAESLPVASDKLPLEASSLLTTVETPVKPATIPQHLAARWLDDSSPATILNTLTAPQPAPAPGDLPATLDRHAQANASIPVQWPSGYPPQPDPLANLHPLIRANYEQNKARLAQGERDQETLLQTPSRTPQSLPLVGSPTHLAGATPEKMAPIPVPVLSTTHSQTYTSYLPVVMGDNLPSESVTITPENGGVFVSADGQVRVEVPPGAVTSETILKFRHLPDQIVSGYQGVNRFFELTAQDTQGDPVFQFRRNLTLTVSYTETAHLIEETLALYFRANTPWQPITSTVYTTTNQVIAIVDHFTDFALLFPLSVDWAVGNIVGLCEGTEIRHGPGLAVHTIVPEDNWLVKVIGGPRLFNEEVWWDTSRKEVDQLPTSGTGWVSQSQEAASCLGGGGGDPGGDLGSAPLSAELRALLRTLGLPWWIDSKFWRGDPVNPATGNFVQQVTDLTVPGVAGFDFILQRTYNSLDEREGLFGFGWSSWLDMKLRIANDGSIDVDYPDGHGVYFLAEGDAYIPGQTGVFDTLTYHGSGFELTTPDQISYLFDEFGHLIALHDRHNNSLTLERDPEGDLVRILDTAGRQFDLAYQGNRLASITDPSGRTISYEYDSNGDLVRVTDGNGGIQQFEYNNHRLTNLTDPETILYLQNIYDDQGRVIEQLDASSSHSYFNYDTESQTLFTDNLGRQTRDSYDQLFRITRVEDALGQTEHYAYDPDYNVTAYTDKRGYTWTYSYDERGNLLAETDPLGHITSYTYNATNDLTSMTDLGGPGDSPRTTTFVYNDGGNLIRIEQPDGTTREATYDDQGQLLSLADGNGHTTTYRYDAEGNLVEVADPLGHQTTYDYDAIGRLTSLTDANDHPTQFEYDGNDNLTHLTDPKNQTTTFSYDLNDNLIQMVDRRGGITRYEYNENLRLVAVTDPEGHLTRYDYDAMYNRIKMTDAQDNVTRYRYDAIDQLIEVENALGGLTAFEYDPNGNLTRIVDALDQATAFEYDPLNRLIKVTDSLDGVTAYQYDAVSRLIQEANPRGATTAYEYDLLDRLTLIRDALGGEWIFDYDAAGNPISVIDANEHLATLRYDAADRLVEQVDAGGHATTFVYDNAGNRTAMTDALERVTHYTYDENHNLATVTDALGNKTTLAYDEEDDLIAVTDANDHPTSFAYDLDGRLITLTEAGGQVTSYAYDATHNLIELTNAKGNPWTYTYDALNRRITGTDPLGHITRYSYDILSRLTRLTDANNLTTRYDYDALNRLIAVVQNEQAGGPTDHQTNVTTSYSYDANGNLTTISDANSHVTTFDYDLLDRLIQEVNPLGQTWQYEYDAVGNLTRRTDAKEQVTHYSYDTDNLLTAISYPDGTGISFGYDAVHNQTHLTDSLGLTENAYDALNRLITTTNHLGQRVSYSYDPVGNRTSLTYPDGRTVHYEYDANNRPEHITNPDGQFFNVEYDPTHNITAIRYPNQTRALHTYDAADRLISLLNEQNNGTPISRFAYTLDAVGNRLHADEYYRWRQPQEMSHDYTYDPLYRLVRSEDSEGRFTDYGYDAVGNRVSLASNYDPLRTPTDVAAYTVTSTYNAANQLLTTDHNVFGLTNYSYDANGNRLRREGPDVWTGSNQDILRTDYTYDFENRLTWTGNSREPGNEQWQLRDEAAMLYDGYGRLFRRTHDMHQGGGGQKSTEYVYDGLEPIAEYVEPNPQYANFYRGLGRILEMQEFKSQQGPNGTAYYFHHDGLGSTSALTKHQGQSAHIYRYWDYGMALDNNGHAADASNFTNPHNHYTFTGQEWNEDLWLYHFYAREYDPSVGGWLQQDPYHGRLDMPMTLQRYGYVGGNPINYVDVLGFDRSTPEEQSKVEKFVPRQIGSDLSVDKVSGESARLRPGVMLSTKDIQFISTFISGNISDILLSPGYDWEKKVEFRTSIGLFDLIHSLNLRTEVRLNSNVTIYQNGTVKIGDSTEFDLNSGEITVSAEPISITSSGNAFIYEISHTTSGIETKFGQVNISVSSEDHLEFHPERLGFLLNYDYQWSPQTSNALSLAGLFVVMGLGLLF